MIDAIIDLLCSKQHFIITGHKNPDGDAIGSCYALALALKKMGKTPIVLLESHAEKYNIIPGQAFLHKGPTDTLETDVFICMDCAAMDRMGVFQPLFERTGITICIDHHETNAGFADYNLINPAAAATSEMVFSIIDHLPAVFSILPDADIASAIYAGIVSDTGGFRHSTTSRETMEITCHLMEMGIDFTHIYNEMLHTHSFNGGKIFASAIASAQRSLDERIVYTHVTREMINDTGALYQDLDNIVEYLLGTRGAAVSVFMYEGKNTPEVKASFRSRGLHVGRIAQELGGGGHQMAAGCTMQGDIHALLPQVISRLQKALDAETPIPAPTYGVLNIYKEADYTSHDVVAIVRKALNRVKTGHTGTLDPQAEGVLPICIGPATKLADYIASANKTYVAEVILGVTTNTGDMTGEALSSHSVVYDEEKIRTAVQTFVGEQQQIPPMFSAIKIDGQKLYQLARKGKTVERKPRQVHINSIQVLSFAPEKNAFTIEVICSKGTYIRSLCTDIGAYLGCGAAMGRLIRSRSGIFSLENAVKLAELNSIIQSGRLQEILIPVDTILPHPKAVVSARALSRARNGNAIMLDEIIIDTPPYLGAKIWLSAPDRTLIGLFTVTGAKLRPEVML